MRSEGFIVVLTVAALAACGSDSKTSALTNSDSVSDADTAPVIDQDAVVDFDTNTAAETTTTDGEQDVAKPDTAPEVVLPPQPGEFGYECNDNDDCNSGWCVQTSTGRRCTRTCQDECPPFFDCREAPGLDATFICLERFLHLCEPCDETTACNESGQSGNFCLSYGAKGSFCGGVCEADPDCPTGFVCREVPVGGGGVEKQCVPTDNGDCSCSPLAKALQLSTTCYIENDNGRCEGSRFCTQGGLNLCDAEQPFPESCNGADDNCNDQVDEFAPDYQCIVPSEHGDCFGTGTCIEGVETCVGAAAVPEQCNQIDDDCDGETDEELCDDMNDCTEDFCNSDGECEHTPLSTGSCDDGSICTGTDICQDGVCMGFNELECDDGNVCKTWFCDPTVGCLSSNNNKPCEDGEPCTDGDQCSQGGCVAGLPKICDDGSECTTDLCVSGVGCQFSPVGDSNPCGGGSGACQTGQCFNGVCQGIPANEGLPCTLGGLGACREAICQGGQCQARNIPANSNTGCSLGGDCPQGVCDGGGGCDVKQPQTCSTEVGFLFCTEDVPGICSATGNCEPTSGSCQCTGQCSSFCICCFGAQLCLDFLFGF